MTRTEGDLMDWAEAAALIVAFSAGIAVSYGFQAIRKIRKTGARSLWKKWVKQQDRGKGPLDKHDEKEAAEPIEGEIIEAPTPISKDAQDRRIWREWNEEHNRRYGT